MPDELEPPKRRGRPKAPDRKVPATTWLRPAEHEKLLALAKRHEVSVSRVLRHLVSTLHKRP